MTSQEPWILPNSNPISNPTYYLNPFFKINLATAMLVHAKLPYFGNVASKIDVLGK